VTDPASKSISFSSARDGRVAAVEVKAVASVSEDDIRGRRLLRDRLGTDFACGVVLHCGERSDSFGDRLLALPISALWTPGLRRRRQL
jgi:hypothetical protein